MPDESAISRGAVWARIRVTAVPADLRRKLKEIEIGVEVCSMPDPGDAIGSWSVELHTEGATPASGGAHKDLGQDRADDAPKETFHAEVVFRSTAALTHIKSRCETWKGERFTKAVRLPEALTFMPGDRARVEIQVYSDSTTAPIARPSVEVFQEPELGHAALGSTAPRAVPNGFKPAGFGLTGRIPTRPIGLFY